MSKSDEEIMAIAEELAQEAADVIYGKLKDHFNRIDVIVPTDLERMIYIEVKKKLVGLSIELNMDFIEALMEALMESKLPQNSLDTSCNP